MITKKTKLLSALVAVVMLISMFTVFAMPAVAATDLTEDEAKALTNASKVTAATDEAVAYQVANLADLNHVATYGQYFGTNVVLYITDDIVVTEGAAANDLGGKAGSDTEVASETVLVGVQAAINGLGNTISGIEYSGSYGWLDMYKGAYIKNLNFYDCSFTDVDFSQFGGVVGRISNPAFYMENIVMDYCYATRTAGSGKLALLVGYTEFAEACTLNFRNITITNCELDVGSSNAGDGAAFVIAGFTGTIPAIVIDGLYMDGNILSGTYKYVESHDSLGLVVGRSMNAADTSAVELTVKNALIKNTTVDSGTMAGGIMLGGSGNTGEKFVFDNIVAYNNNLTVDNGGYLYFSRLTGGTQPDVTNVATDVSAIHRDTGLTGATNTTTLADITTGGELLYNINANNGTGTDWAIVAGSTNEVVAANATNKAIGRVSFVTPEGTVYRYTDSTGKLLTAAPELEGSSWQVNDADVTLPETFEDGASYKDSAVAVDKTALQEAYEYWDGKDAQYFAAEGLADDIARADEILNEDASTDAEEVASLAADLNAAKALGYATDAKIPVALVGTYSDATAFAVSSPTDVQTVAGNPGAYTKSMTLYLTANIDCAVEGARTAISWAGVNASIDGQGYTLSGIEVAYSFLGDYAGSLIEDITFENFEATDIPTNKGLLIGAPASDSLTLRNVVADGLIGDGDSTAGNYQRGLLIGTITKTVTVENVTLTGSTLTVRKNLSVGLLAAKVDSNGTLNIDGYYAYGNTMTADASDGSGSYFGFITGQVQDSTATINAKNIVLGNNTRTNATGNLAFGIPQSSCSVTNLVAYGNTGSTSIVTAASSLVSATTGAVDGATVYAHNAAVAEANDSTLKTWTIKDGAIVAVDATNKAPAKVTFVGATETQYIYTDASGALLSEPTNLTGTSWLKNDVETDLTTATFADGDVYTDNAVTVDLTALRAALEYWNGKEAQYFNAEGLAEDLNRAKEIDANNGADTDADEVAALVQDLANAKAAGYKTTAYIPAAQYDNYTDAIRFGVGSVEDINEVSANASAFTAAKLIYVTDHIDLEGATIASWSGVNARIDGQGYTISNAKVNVASGSGAGAWLGNYGGSYFGDITLKGWESTGTSGSENALVFGMPTGDNLLIEDLTMDDCTMTSGQSRIGLIVGRAQAGNNTAGKTITFKGVNVLNSELAITGNGSDGVAFLIGGFTSTAGKAHNTVVENLYMDNNNITGTTATAAYHQGIGIVIGRPTDTTSAVDLSINNAVVKNTTISDGVMRGAVLAGSYGAAGLDIAISNVIAYNNDVDTLIMGRDSDTIDAPVNTFADTDYLITGYNGSNVLSGPTTNADKTAAVAAIASGEAVYTLNKATATDATKWVVKSGEVVEVSASESLPIKVTFFPADGDEFSLYTGIDGKLTGDNAATVYATTWKIDGEGDAITFTADSTNYTDGASYYEPGASIDTTALAEIYAYFDGKEYSYYADTELATKMANAKAILDGTAASITVDSVAAAKTALDAAKTAGYAAGVKIPASVAANYKDAPAFAVASKPDFLTVAADPSIYTAGKTIYITADIDVTGETAVSWDGVDANIDGGNNTITGLAIATTTNVNSWLGASYEGSFIKDITFKDCTVSGIGAGNGGCGESLVATLAKDGFTATNITLDSVNGSATSSATTYHGALLFGTNNSSATFYLNDITIKNSSLDLSGIAGSQYDMTMVIACNLAKSVYIDGLTMLSNKMLNANTAASNQSFVFGQHNTDGGVFSVENAVIMNNLVTGTVAKDVRTIGGRYSKGTVNVDNAVVVNNYVAENTAEDGAPPVYTFVNNVEKLGNTLHTVTNVYTDALRYANNHNQLEEEDIGTLADVLSGEALHALNAANGNDATDWAIKDGAVVATDTDVAAPVKVTVTLTYTNHPTLTTEEAILYTDSTGKLLGADAIASKLALATDWSKDLTGTFAADETVTGTHTCVGSDTWTTVDGVHSKTCTNTACGAVFASGNCEYAYTAPATPAAGTKHTKACTVCEDEIEEDCSYALDPDHADAVAGDCESGSVAVWVCGGCDATYKITSSASGHDEVMTHKGDSVANSYHEYVCQNANCTYTNNTRTVACTVADYTQGTSEASCTEPGKITYTCNICAAADVETVYSVSNVGAPAGHSYGNWVLTTAPTTAAEGVKTRTCTLCDEETEGHAETAAVANTGARIIVDGGAATVGSTIDVDVDLKDIPVAGVSGVTLLVEFDASALELQAIKKDNSVFDTVTTADLEDNAIVDLTTCGGKIKVSAVISDIDSVLVGSGNVFTLTFKVKAGTSEGKYGINVSNTNSTDGAATSTLSIAEGIDNIEVTNGFIGDIDKNGRIGIADAVILARFVAGVEGYGEDDYDTSTMDCDGNGKIETADITYLMWYVNGWVNTIG